MNTSYMSNWFKGRKLVIATKHEKEKVMEPLLKDALEVDCLINTAFDTDTLGTFTGETTRKDDPLTTARKKCLAVMDHLQCDLGIANEGSFGPHPSLLFVPADDEIVILIDRKNNLEITAREISTATNFNGKNISHWDELKSFADEIGFPSHGLIIKKDEKDHVDIRKGINDWQELEKLFHEFQSRYGSFFAETDMRAMYNPSRMKVIEQATIKLIEKINSVCPACNAPGFSVTSAKEGLPCSACSAPTRSIISHNYTCQKCSYSLEKRYPYDKHAEDPMYCDFCNP